MIGIYKITSPTGKVYVGQSSNLSKRYLDYVNIVNCKNQTRLYNSLIKYGFSEHIFEVVEECNTGELNVRERYWQEFYDVLGSKGLNCRLTGAVGRVGKLSEDTKEKISKTKTGKKKSQEHIEKMRQARTGKTVSEESREKIRSANIGKKLSQETRQKISEAKRGVPMKSPKPEEVKQRISATLKGRKPSEETRLKLSEAAKKRWKKVGS